jgi:hypothetical protein
MKEGIGPTIPVDWLAREMGFTAEYFTNWEARFLLWFEACQEIESLIAGADMKPKRSEIEQAGASGSAG